MDLGEKQSAEFWEGQGLGHFLPLEDNGVKMNNSTRTKNFTLALTTSTEGNRFQTASWSICYSDGVKVRSL
jgi:hypothetical protein